MRIPVLPLLPFLVLAVAAEGIAQRRSPFFATVVDAAGRPLAGATVTCCSTPTIASTRPADVVAAVTDARGRARPELLVGSVYVAWAVGVQDADGAYAAGEPVPLIAAGRIVELTAGLQRSRQRMRMVGANAWREVGGVALRWFPAGGQDVHEDLPFPTDERVVLPPAPWATGQLAIVDEQGQPMVVAAVEPHATALPPFTAPMAIAARAVDADGKPLAEVDVGYCISLSEDTVALFGRTFGTPPAARSLGRTDREGVVRGHVATPAPVLVRGSTGRGHLPLHASRDGCCDAHQVVDGPGEFTLVLQPAATTTLRFADIDTARLEVAATTSWFQRGGTGMTFGIGRVRVQRDGERWLVQTGERGFTPRCTWLGDQPTAVVADHVPKPVAGLTIGFASAQGVAVRVIGEDGTPTPAVVGVARAGEGAPVYWDAVLATDTAGRATLRLPAAGHLVYATTGSAHALALVAGERVDLRLQPLPILRVRTVDAQRRPLTGARVRAFESRYRSPSAEPLERQWDRLASEMHAGYVTMGRNLGDGVLAVPVFLRPGLEATIEVRVGDRRAVDVPLRAGGEVEVVVED